MPIDIEVTLPRFESDDSASNGLTSDKSSEFIADCESELSLRRFDGLPPSMNTGLQNIVGTTKLLMVSLSSSISSLSDISFSSSSQTILPNSLPSKAVSLFGSSSQLLPLLFDGDCLNSDDDGTKAIKKGNPTLVYYSNGLED